MPEVDAKWAAMQAETTDRTRRVVETKALPHVFRPSPRRDADATRHSGVIAAMGFTGGPSPMGAMPTPLFPFLLPRDAK